MRLHPDREGAYPLLYLSGYEVASRETIDFRYPRYNCIAFAADDQTLWWWPDHHGDGFWPKGAKREVTREAFIQAYGTIGYAVCDNGEVEAGYDKIALYEKNGVPTHAAKQLEDGWWKSKLGEWEDIKHKTVEAVQTFRGIGLYGEVAFYMKRIRA
jgi:hypothetical protein